jgi:mono/diheme cytochrome c family protein
MTRIAGVSLAVLLSVLPLVAVLAQSVPQTKQNTSKGAVNSHLKAQRLSRLDLEVGGNITGLFQGAKAYLRRSDLLALPQVSFTVSDDANFAEPVQVRGVELDVLVRRFAAEGEQAVMVAICDDWYRAFYPQAYREIHKPLLVLEINGRPPSGWPKSKEGASMGPYLITQPRFTPAFKILAHQDEAQIPWGVIELDFVDEKTVYGPIEPLGPTAQELYIQNGYRVAQQNCLRCHGVGDERTKGTITWSALGIIAKRSPEEFAGYVRDPKAFAPSAEMPGNPDYDSATLEALTAYFQTFAPAPKQ